MFTCPRSPVSLLRGLVGTHRGRSKDVDTLQQQIQYNINIKDATRRASKERQGVRWEIQTTGMGEDDYLWRGRAA